MSENDYIAEYVKEKRPELIKSFDYQIWKMIKILENFVVDVTDALCTAFIPEEDNDDTR